MLRFIGRRVGYMLVTIFIIITATFFLMRLMPGDPLADMAQKLPEQTRINFYAKYGLDKPLTEQYAIFIKNLVTKGDLGESLQYPGKKVTDVIITSSPVSFAVGGRALVIGLVIGVALGIVAALYKNRWPDYIVMFIAILGITVPVFVLAAVLQYVLAVQLQWVPPSGWGKPVHFVIPVAVMCLGTIATYARYIKSSMLDTLGQDYILTARAKGVSEFNVIRKHVMRNSLLPAITILGGRIVGIFTGSFVIERMFSIPGLGFYYVSSITNRDYTMTMGTTIFFACLFVVVQLIIDIIYMFVDPRIRSTQIGR